jgi:hypothetical protein
VNLKQVKPGTKSSERQQESITQNRDTSSTSITTGKAKQKVLETEEKKQSKGPKLKQCYVEEQAKLRDSFMVEAYKILKNLVKNVEIFLVYI